MSRTTFQIARCAAAHAMVRIDQTQGQCTREHGCPPGRHCPLAGSFANIHAAQRDVRGDGRSSGAPRAGK